MNRPSVQLLPVCFRQFPGVVLQLSADGTITDSNGRLERELGRQVMRRPFAELLDPDSSLSKWNRILEMASDDPASEKPTGASLAEESDKGEPDHSSPVWELIFKGDETLPEPRAFAVLWEREERRFWLLEHRPDPRLDALHRQVLEVNSELANTQRELLKERSRLARALEDLERSNRALDAFAHAVSHDLRAPLRSIDNYATWLEEDLGNALTGESRQHLDRLRNRVTRMHAMIQGVLEYARIARYQPPPEPVDVGGLVREVIELLDPPERLDVQVESMPVVVTGRAPLQQVFYNLVGNAVRYAGGPRPRVRIGVRDAGQFHEFYVADNGPGMPERAQEKIWSLFHTVEPEERAQGTGIGLAVVKRLVEGQGGTVWVESRVGEGATFRFLWLKANGTNGLRG
ncbi:MAG TPA: ATP-binding protein [Longimicrobiaceae bacterium]